MPAKTLAAAMVSIVAMAQAALAARQPVTGASTSVNTVEDGIRASQGEFYKNLHDGRIDDANANSYSSLHYSTPSAWVPRVPSLVPILPLKRLP